MEVLPLAKVLLLAFLSQVSLALVGELLLHLTSMELDTEILLGVPFPTVQEQVLLVS